MTRREVVSQEELKTINHCFYQNYYFSSFMPVALTAESEAKVNVAWIRKNWKKVEYVVSTLSWWFKTSINVFQKEHKYLAVKRLQVLEQKKLPRAMFFETFFSLNMFKSVSKAISKQIVKAFFISK